MDTIKYPFTAFEACGQLLYQFRRIPFGVTNGLTCFATVIKSTYYFKRKLKTYWWLIVSEQDQESHDKNLQKLLSVMKKCIDLLLTKININLINVRFLFWAFRLRIFNTIKPDPERLKPLLSLPFSQSSAELKRSIGMFLHCSKCIPRFSDNI